MKYDKLARFTDRLEGESSKAHRARITYLLLGPQRSIARAAQTIREREPNNTDIRLFGEWSTNFKWTAQAEDYDSAVAYLAACQELDTYLADVEAYSRDELLNIVTNMIKRYPHLVEEFTKDDLPEWDEIDDYPID